VSDAEPPLFLRGSRAECVVRRDVAARHLGVERLKAFLRQCPPGKRHRAALALRTQLRGLWCRWGCDLRHRDEPIRGARIWKLVFYGRFLPGLGPNKTLSLAGEQ
jgi:hypothetical protein